MQPLFGADRTVARGDHLKIGGAFKAHKAAMASAGEGLAFGHVSAPVVSVGSRRAISGKFAASSFRVSSDELVDPRSLSRRQRRLNRRLRRAGVVGIGIG